MNPHILLAERLDYLCSADEDHLDLIFGFYNYAFEYLSHNLVIIGHQMVCQSFKDSEDLIEAGLRIFPFLLDVCNLVELALQAILFIHQSACFFFIEDLSL